MNEKVIATQVLLLGMLKGLSGFQLQAFLEQAKHSFPSTVNNEIDKLKSAITHISGPSLDQLFNCLR
jgi:hypothetical protein